MRNSAGESGKDRRTDSTAARLHVPPGFAELAALRVADGFVPLPPTLADVAAWETFVGAFSAATHWTARVTAAPAPPARKDLCSLSWPAAGDAAPRYWTLEAAPQGALPRAQVEPLAQAAVELARELEETRLALWQREAELAAAVPVVPHRNEPAALAKILESLVRSAAEAVECQAAGLYLLDEGTSELKLRALWNLPLQRLLAPARPLRGALADLEALAGHAVTLEETRLAPQWRVPEPRFGSAACVPVATTTTLLGTLWTFGDQPRDFTDRQANLLEIVAGRIAVELEREVLLQAAVAARGQDKANAAARRAWQGFRPASAPALPGWKIAAAIWPEEQATGSLFDWSLGEENLLHFALGTAEGTNADEALPAAATILATLRAERTHAASPAALVERLGSALMAASTAGERGSLVCGTLDASTGTIALAGGGTGRAIHATRRTGKLIITTSELLGSESEGTTSARAKSFELPRGETLVLVNDALWQRWAALGAKRPERAIATALRKRGKRTAAKLIGRLIDQTPDQSDSPRGEPCAALVVYRANSKT